MNVFVEILGVVLLAFSILSFCVWVFLFVDDTNALQNRLTIWWSWAESTKTKLFSQEQNLLQGIAALTSLGFDHLFGNKLISRRSISASICFSLASMGIMVIVLASLSEAYQSLVLPALILSVFFVFLASTRIRWFRETTCILVLITLALSSISILVSSESTLLTIVRPKLAQNFLKSIDYSGADQFEDLQRLSDDELTHLGFTVSEVQHLRGLTFKEFDAEFQSFNNSETRDGLAKAIETPLAEAIVNDAGYEKIGKYGRAVLASINVIALVLALCSDFAVILITRKLLRLSTRSPSLVRFLVITFINLTLAILLFLVPFALGFCFQLPYRFEMAFVMLAAMNWSVVLIAFSSLIIAFVLTINRLIWPNVVVYLDAMSTKEVLLLQRHCCWLWIVSFGVSAELLGVNWLSSFF